MSSLLTFSDVEKITKYLNTNNLESLFSFFSTKGDILQILKIVKNTIYNSKEDVAFEIDKPGFKGDIIISKNDFIPNIPKDKVITVNINNINFTLGYPSIVDSNFDINKLSSIKQINGNYIDVSYVKEIATNISLKTYKELLDIINTSFILNLNKVLIFNHKNKDFKSDFSFDIYKFYKLLILVCKYSQDYLNQLKLILMKESNFSFGDFKEITVEESINYYKLLNKFTNESASK